MNQRDAYDKMRKRCPVAQSEFLGWSLFRHSDIRTVVSDPTTYSNDSKYRSVPNGMDPPEHTRYRQAIDTFFTAKQIAAFESDARRLCREAVEAAHAQETVEFASEFSGPLCSKLLCTFLGWPEDTWIPILEWTHGNQEVALSRNREAGANLARELAEIVLGQIQARRYVNRKDSYDLTTVLMETEVDGHRLTDDELVSVLRNWIAGHGTVAAALEILLFHMASNQALQRRLRSDPALVPAAADEILRSDGPLVANSRTTNSDVAMGGRHIAAGERLTLMWIAANRDSSVFDSPDEIQLDRDQHQNLLYGSGIHDCAGAPLARLELAAALDEILSGTKAVELSNAEPRRALYPSNGFAELVVRFH